MEYPPSMISNWGPDYMLHCRGIYYRDRHFSHDVLATRKVWVPKLPQHVLDDTAENRELLSRAHALAARSRNNESWCKSEYAWEADAWSHVFGKMREDPCLALYVQAVVGNCLEQRRLTLAQGQAQIFGLHAEIRRNHLQAHR